VDTIGETRESRSALSWIVVDEPTSPFAQRAFRGVLAKQVLDFTCALGLLVVLAVLLAVLALAVRLSSPGPTLFVQRRIGKNGKSFSMYKFRTMHVGSDVGSGVEIHRTYVRALIGGVAEPNAGAFKLIDDPRVTPFGRVLRRFSLDELPQLFNVLKGDMSLVGPRPPLGYEVELYGARERARLSVPPGLTGLWQISGRSELSFHQMVDLDLQYISRWSFWLDLKILLVTPLIVLTGRGAR
jgi:lipopolysaccharide/colanic/teichoic acid biosynthesis glycosyltransferase